MSVIEPLLLVTYHCEWRLGRRFEIADPMDHEWVPRTPGELRRHATKLQAIAALVHRSDVASHLREHAAALLAEAELKAAAGRD